MTSYLFPLLPPTILILTGFLCILFRSYLAFFPSCLLRTYRDYPMIHLSQICMGGRPVSDLSHHSILQGQPSGASRCLHLLLASALSCIHISPLSSLSLSLSLSQAQPFILKRSPCVCSCPPSHALFPECGPSHSISKICLPCPWPAMSHQPWMPGPSPRSPALRVALSFEPLQYLFVFSIWIYLQCLKQAFL